jgi:hypothetical protein
MKQNLAKFHLISLSAIIAKAILVSSLPLEHFRTVMTFFCVILKLPGNQYTAIKHAGNI